MIGRSQPLEGRPVVVHFFAMWCEACMLEMPAVRELEHSLARLETPLIWISLDDPKDAFKVGALLRRHGLKATAAGRAALLEAPDPGPITARFNPRWQAELPATFVVLQSGEVAASHLGTTPVEMILKEARNQINAGHPPPARSTK